MLKRIVIKDVDIRIKLKYKEHSHLDQNSCQRRWKSRVILWLRNNHEDISGQDWEYEILFDPFL